jgi:hypothetical protein
MTRWVLVACLAACGGEQPASSVDAGAGINVFDPMISQVVLEIDYETGQEPYTGSVVGFGDVFDPTVENLERVFAGSKALTVPRTLAEMSDLGPIADDEVTIYDVRDLAAMHRGQRDTATTKTYYVVFLSGYFANDQGPQQGVLGVAVEDTIAVFKDVIRTSSVVPNVLRFVEQTVLTHELGHAIGLVDNGVPMLSDHKDEVNGAHCTNPDCVMYWLNNNGREVTAYVQRRYGASASVLFGPECLADVDARTGGP